jgi:hypothetical protein
LRRFGHSKGLLAIHILRLPIWILRWLRLLLWLLRGKERRAERLIGSCIVWGKKAA